MNRLSYLGNGNIHPSRHAIDTRSQTRYRRPEDYIAEPGLVNAVNVALLLDKPLLLTGEPGTGKSQLAHSLCWELGLGEVLVFETKSTSTAKDLFYSFDTVGRFRATEGSPAKAFLAYNALGKAILYANDGSSVAQYVTPDIAHLGKRRSIVLIDEVDKAPRDFPNDILNELEYLHFAVPEIGSNVITADLDFRPIVIITSNSEKDLPDAFLRRCIYYNVPFPDPKTLKEIVVRRLGEFTSSSSALLGSALDLFFRLRDPSSRLRKNPATAELLDWLLALRVSEGKSEPDFTQELANKTISALIKTAEDQERAHEVIEKWYKSRG